MSDVLAGETTSNYRQPSGLYILFFAEFWERFGFYIVQALLVLYMTQVFDFGDDKAFALFGSFSAFQYAMPILGGWLADRLFGYRIAIFIGAACFILGYFSLALLPREYFTLALGLLIIGNGFFKGNVSSLLGTLYNEDDPRRDSGFTLFYLGMNIGSALAGLLGGYVSKNYGWHAAFGLAGTGISVGMVICWFQFKKLGKHGLPPAPQLLARKYLGINLSLWSMVSIMLAVAMAALLIHYPVLIEWGLACLFLGGVSYLLFTLSGESAQERKQFYALLVLLLFSVVFWAFYFQAFQSVMLFVDRHVDLVVMGYELSPAVSITIIGIYIILLAPLFAQLWFKLSLAGKDPSYAAKFTLALLAATLGFLVLWYASKYQADAAAKISPLWLCLSYFLLVIGEMCISPIGLSVVTVLAPKRYVGLSMGLWMMTLAVAYEVGGWLASLVSVSKEIKDVSISLAKYQHGFFIYFEMLLVATILLAVLTPFVNRLINNNS